MRAALVATTLVLGACGHGATIPLATPPAGGHPFHDYPDPTPTTTTEAPTTTTTTTTVARVEAQRASRSGSRDTPDWAALRQCESGDNYATNTGNGFYGAYQANRGTWDGLWQRHDRADLVGVLPSDASADDQDEFARLLYAERGAQPWPTCGRYLN